MVLYSHSKLSVYEQCPLRYKYKYVEKLIPEFERTIESHLGDIIHQTMEWLYICVKEGKIPTIEEVITYYSKKWEENYSPAIKDVKKELSQEDYFNKGIKFILDYYTKHKPFDDNTIEIEKRVVINLGEHKLQGYIDRLSYNLQAKEFEIHDYKTTNGLPAKKKIKQDKQLALYSLAIKELFGEEKKVCLTWHYLAHNLKVCVRKTQEELEQLKKEIAELINKIESTREFPSKKSMLCSWCGYKKICPEFKRKSEGLEQFPTIRKYLRG